MTLLTAYFIGAFALAPVPAMAEQNAPASSALPGVLIVGDSISAGYTPTVVERLRGKALVQRAAAAGGPTTEGLKHLSAALEQRRWDVIHFNWGLHDIKLGLNDERQTPVTDYEANLRRLVEQMRATGASLIWATTTPVPEGTLSPRRRKGDEVIYNRVARRIMEDNGVTINDLYSFVLPRADTMQLPANVHFTPAGYEQLGQQVAAQILSALEKSRQ
jgi:lysophospholipase L1-like esterase